MSKSRNILSRIRIRSYLLSFLFIVVIFIPISNLVFDYISDEKINENRVLAPVPVLKMNNLDPFPHQFEMFFEDHFVLRNYFLKQYMRLNLILLQKSTIPDKAVIGTDGWLFMSGFELESYRGDSLFSQNELDEFTREIARRDSIVRASGATYYFVIVPCKHSVYPEFLPGFAKKKVPKNNAELLSEKIKSETNIHCLYLLDSLTAHKGEYNLYSKTDNHWNHLGAFYGSRAVTAMIHKDFPVVKPLSLSDYKIVITHQNGGNIAEMFGMQSELTEDFVSLVPIKSVKAVEVSKQNYPSPPGFAYPWEYEMAYSTCDSALPKMLVVRESFGGYAMPYLSENSLKAVFIFDAWQHKFHSDIFASEQPDIYIQFVMEGFLRQMLRYSREEKMANPAE